MQGNDSGHRTGWCGHCAVRLRPWQWRFCSEACYQAGRRPDLVARLEAHTDRSGACWPYPAARSAAGYGQIGVGRQVLYAHRIAYELAHGPIPDGQVICHTCDVPACVNPAHLYAAPQADNVADAIRKGRHVPPPRRTMPVRERFWSKVDRSGGAEACWPWQASLARNGYGQFGVGGRAGGMVVAHRVAWELTNGPIPEGLHVLHRCDVRRCVNPAHLFLGTHTDNVRDMWAKGRAGSQTHPERMARGDRHGWRLHPDSIPRGERSGAAKLTEADVRDIRRMWAAGYRNRTSIGKMFGVTRTLISTIVTHKSWTHIE